MPNQFVRRLTLFLLATQIIVWGILTYEYLSYLHILACGTLALLLWFFHYVYVYSLEHRPKSFYLPLIFTSLYGILITYAVLFHPYINAPMEYGISRFIILFFLYLFISIVYTYEPKPLRRK